MKSFTSVEELTTQVCLALKVPTAKLQLIYYEPGHGTKGKKVFINDDDDIDDPKKLYDKKDVLLWCYDPCVEQPIRSKKRSQAGSDKNNEGHALKVC